HVASSRHGPGEGRGAQASGSGLPPTGGRTPMELDDLVIVSVDDCVIEAPHLLAAPAEALFPRAPVVRHSSEKNEDIWELEGKPSRPVRFAQPQGLDGV